MSMCKSLCLDFPIPSSIFLLSVWSPGAGTVKHSSVNQEKPTSDQRSVHFCNMLDGQCVLSPHPAVLPSL